MSPSIPDQSLLDLTSAIIREPLIVSPDATVMDAIAQMSDARMAPKGSCVLVVENNRLVGILTERDVVFLSAQGYSLDHLAIREVMFPTAIALHESAFTDLLSALQLLQLHQMRCLPILDEQDFPIGLVTDESLLQVLGSANYCCIQAIPETEAEGRTVGQIDTLTDITDCKLAEQQLQGLNRQLQIEVEERTAALFEKQHFIEQITESTTAILYIFDHIEQRNIYANSQITTILGYSPEEIQAMGKQFLPKLLHPNDLSRFIEHKSQFDTIADNEVLEVEYRMRHVNGEWRWLQNRDRVFKRTPEGIPCQIIGTAIDISDRKLAEQQLQHLNQVLETKVQERTAKLQEREQELLRATRLKDEFLANMSHELRTPLNALLGMAEGLLEGVFGELVPEQHKALQTIERSGSHLLDLINDILDLAKVESGQIELERKPTAVTSLCQASLAFVKQQAFKKQIQLESNFPPHLPELDVDERYIRQALINLLNNAVKFTPDGGHITLEVSLQTLEDEPESSSPTHLRISVVDTGIGIAPEHLGKLFQPFVQIDTALNRKYDGTGLGLALVKRIVELHDGKVSISSTVGIGSCFTIDLPCATYCPLSSYSAGLKSSVYNNLSPRQTEWKRSPLLLLAEDNEANISTMSSYLRAKGYRLLVAKEGQEALELAQSEHPDLILMDVQMPGMDGLEAMQKIRQDPHLADVPIIALTGLAMTGDRDRCLAAGANDYLSKPVKLKQLTTAIQHLLAPQEENL